MELRWDLTLLLGAMIFLALFNLTVFPNSAFYPPENEIPHNSNFRTTSVLEEDAYLLSYSTKVGFQADKDILQRYINQHRSLKSKYILFEDDTGGWNNIRIAFEVFTTLSFITGRTLVIPFPSRFYLLDRGPVTLFEKNKTSHSTYSDYYDFYLLKKWINVITIEEFFQTESDFFNSFPEEIKQEIELVRNKPFNNGHHSKFFLWMRENKEVQIFPTGPSLRDVEFNFYKQCENSSFEVAGNSLVLYFPMHVSKNLRYLGGIPNLLKTQSVSQNSCTSELQKLIKRFLRQAFQYSPKIWNKANEVVRLLGGAASFSSLHIRRNELQYAEVFLSGQQSVNNVKDLLNGKEVLYISTDETEAGFFQPFKNEGFEIWTLKNVKDKYPEVFAGFEPKYEGMVEQLICASGRLFFGTPMSTFSSYIIRLRGYMYGEGLRSRCLFHTRKNSMDKNSDCFTGFKKDAQLWKI
eukprot:maker-scaffold_15-snap-gene-6.39-mRNA-1 protein AED:0.00 eAED:0.00 QI:15/1/1/1/1/1/3/21/464